MDRLEIAPGLWVDARRAVWLARERTLVVTDLHLGYAWAQRQRGALLPLADVEEAGARLRRLQHEYRPETLVFLGDLVHGAHPADPIAAALRVFLGELAAASQLVLTLGNHDASVPAMAARLALPLRCELVWRAGPHRLLHGDGTNDILEETPPEGLVIMGHEHPVLLLADDVATCARCPCFLEGDRRLMLPAFSRWAAGVVAGREPFMSGIARTARWHTAVAIVGHRLLRVPWQA